MRYGLMFDGGRGGGLFMKTRRLVHYGAHRLGK